MKKLWTISKIPKAKLNFQIYFWLGWLLLIIIALIAGYFFLPLIFKFYGLAGNPSEIKEYHSQIVRNLGWLAWMAVSFIGLSIGLNLAIWGRQIQHESLSHDRLEKATAMLGSEVMAVRIAGSHLLMSLGIDDASMKSLCVRLLFAFISNPYLKKTDEGKDTNDLFSDIEESLRADIQEAADNFCAIYRYYRKKGVDNERVKLPPYFWKKVMKNTPFLMRANLIGEEMKEAFLCYTNLQKANLLGANLQEAILKHVDFQGANLQEANLQEVDLEHADLKGSNLFMADITNAKMEKAKNLTKKQILSARWGVYGKIETERPPLLPDEIKNDPEVQEWLATSYNKIRKEELKNLKE